MSQNKSALISVVIPCYNGARTIGRALESVLEQSLPAFEIIVVDDASVDATSQALAHYPTVTVICHQHNQGAAGARNTGITQAKGQYIAFLDADDAWRPDKLRIQLAHLLETKADATCTSFTIHRGQKQKEYILHPPKNWENFILNGCSISPGSTLLVKSSVFKSLGLFNTKLARLEDWAWLIDFVFQGHRLSLCSQMLADVYTTGFPSATRVMDALQELRQIQWQNPRLTKPHKARFQSACAYEMAAVYKRQGAWARMVGSLLKSFFRWPNRYV